MLLRGLVAASLLASNTPAVPQTPAPYKMSAIPKVICPNPKDDSYTAGSAVRVDASHLVTAAHVISNGNCQIDGQPVKVFYKSLTADFMILEDKRPGDIVDVDCGGYVAGKKYIAVGHARARDELTGVGLTATGKFYSDIPFLAVLVDIFEVQPGQSGGAIIDPDTSKLVGIVNTGDWERGLSGSIELKSTAICGGRDV